MPCQKKYALLLYLALGVCLNLYPSTEASQSTKNIELTEKDLFATKNWDSSQVDVLGFHLGMTRQEADVHARQNGLKLLIPDLRGSAKCSGEKCELCDAKVVCPGIMLDFSRDDHVVGVEVLKIPDYGAEVVKKSAITNRFKGKTRLLFSRYSDNLRLELVGKEDSQESPADKSPLYERMVTYKYARLGVKIFVSRSPHGPEWTSDIALSFVPPQALTQN